MLAADVLGTHARVGLTEDVDYLLGSTSRLFRR